MASKSKIVPLAVAPWGATDAAERALRQAYQEDLRRLGIDMRWLGHRIMYCRRKKDSYLASVYLEERRDVQRQIRQIQRILALINAHRDDRALINTRRDDEAPT